MILRYDSMKYSKIWNTSYCFNYIKPVEDDF